jgi:hypothetical protein
LLPSPWALDCNKSLLPALGFFNFKNIYLFNYFLFFF